MVNVSNSVPDPPTLNHTSIYNFGFDRFLDSWCTDTNDNEQRVALGFTESILITMLISSGRIESTTIPGFPSESYVTKFALEYSPTADPYNWIQVPFNNSSSVCYMCMCVCVWVCVCECVCECVLCECVCVTDIISSICMVYSSSKCHNLTRRLNLSSQFWLEDYAFISWIGSTAPMKTALTSSSSVKAWLSMVVLLQQVSPCQKMRTKHV